MTNNRHNSSRPDDEDNYIDDPFPFEEYSNCGLQEHRDEHPSPAAIEIRPKTPSVNLISALDLKPQPIRWLWKEWIAHGKLHLLAGTPGTGKTTLAMDLAACVSSGRALPSGEKPKRGNVLIWSGEDDYADTLLPRLRAAGADLARIKFVGETSENGLRISFDPSRDVEKLAETVTQEVDLIIVDPIVSAIYGDSHRNNDVRRQLAPLVELAAKWDAAILGITHYSKNTQGRDPLERINGSIGFAALARVVLCVARDSGSEQMILARVKSNIGPDGNGFRYAFSQVEVPPEGMTTNCITWGPAIEGTPRELLGAFESDQNDGEHREVDDWLRQLLSTGPVAASEIRKAGGDAGFPWRTLQRAQSRIGATSRREGFQGPMYWNLSSRATSPPVAPDAPSKMSGANGANELSGTHWKGTSP